MTLRKRLEEAAFWDGHVCLVCMAVTNEGWEEGDPCPECGSEGPQDALRVLRFLERADEDED